MEEQIDYPKHLLQAQQILDYLDTQTEEYQNEIIQFIITKLKTERKEKLQELETEKSQKQQDLYTLMRIV
jgi:flagellar motor component MotA